MRTLLLILIIPVFLLQTQAQSLAHKRNNSLGKGINVSNWMEAYWHGTDWPKPNLYDRAFLAEMKNAGFQSVRMPVCFALVTDTMPPYYVDTNSAVFAQIDSVIKWTGELNMNLIIDNHHQWVLTDTTWRITKNRLAHLWSVLAQRYKYLNPDQYFFEILNEPHDVVNDSINIMFKAVIDTIRRYTTQHSIIVSPTSYSAGVGFHQYQPLADTNLIYTMHTYDPYPFTHQGFSWANPFYPTGTTYPSSGFDFLIPAQWRLAMLWRDSFDLPVFLGEFGVGIYADEVSRCNWMDTVSRYINENHLPSFSWDVRWDFRLYNSGVFSSDSIIPCFRRALGLYGDTLQTGITPYDNNDLVKVYPNPATDMIRCTANTSDEVMVQITDNTGRVVFEKMFIHTHQIVTINWPAGIYLLRVTSGNQTSTRKIVIER